MNKIYKIVWSKVKNCYVVASELAKSHTKAPRSGVTSRSFVAGVLACAMCSGILTPSDVEAASAEWYRGSFKQATAEQYFADRYENSGGVVVDVVGIKSVALQKIVMNACGFTWQESSYYGGQWLNDGDDHIEGYGSSNDGAMLYYLVTEANGTTHLHAALNAWHFDDDDGERYLIASISNSDLASAGLSNISVGGTSYTAGNGITISSDNKVYV